MAPGDLDVGLLRQIMIRLGELRETSSEWNPSLESHFNVLRTGLSNHW